MAVKYRPDAYHTVTPYLAVDNAARLLDFLKSAFGAKETEKLLRPDGSVNHAEVQIGDSIVMLGDVEKPEDAARSTLYIYVEDTDRTYGEAIEAGGTSIMEPTDQFYGDRNAAVRDPSGNSWWIATHFEDVPPEELQRRAAQSGSP